MNIRGDCQRPDACSAYTSPSQSTKETPNNATIFPRRDPLPNYIPGTKMCSSDPAAASSGSVAHIFESTRLRERRDRVLPPLIDSLRSLHASANKRNAVGTSTGARQADAGVEDEERFSVPFVPTEKAEAEKIAKTTPDSGANRSREERVDSSLQVGDRKTRAIARKRREVEDATKQFFSFDWYDEGLKRAGLFPEGSFTPAVHWHYINSQYFTSSLNGDTQNAAQLLAHIRSQLAFFLANSSTKTLVSSFMQTQGRTLTLDQLISKAKSEKETASLTMDRLMQSIMAKIASEPSSPLRSEPSEFDILRDSFCPSKVEYKYCEYAEKRRRKLLPSAEGEIQFPGIMQKRGCIRTAGSASILGTRGMDRLLQSQTEESDITSDSGKTPPTGNCTASRPQKRSWVKTWDEIICQVCNGSDQDDRNMIFTLHETCYGICSGRTPSAPPPADWVCKLCLHFGPSGRTVRCACCPNLGGAMKPTNFRMSAARPAGQEVAWVHMSCAFWVPELAFEINALKEPVTGLEFIDKRRFALGCGICGQKGGCCVQCARSKCEAVFHVECARLAGYFLECAPSKPDESIYRIYCEKHPPVKQQRTLEQTQKRTLEEVVNFCHLVDKCRALLHLTPEAEHQKESFTKSDSAVLLDRVQSVCQDFASLTLVLGKPTADADYYHLLSHSDRVSYEDTLDVSHFPWHAVRFGGFSANECFRRYLRLVPDKESFARRVTAGLLAKGKRAEKAERKKKSVVAHNPKDSKRYCVCQRTFLEAPEAMIGKKGCPYNGWLHLACMGLKMGRSELDKLVFYCDACKVRLGKS